MSSLVPGNVSTYNEEMASLLEKITRSYVPCDVKAAFNKLLEHLHNDELDECINAGEELLKQRIPDTTRTRVHVLIASCLADPDEMEEHYQKAPHLWTLLNERYAGTSIDAWLQEARSQLDALSDAIQDERSGDDDDDDQSNPTDTPTKLAMSAIAVVESVPSSSSSSQEDLEPDSDRTSWRSGSIALSARSSASSHASFGSLKGSRLLGVIASQQRYRLPDHVGMSPATILKFAWDPNSTIRSRPLNQSSQNTSIQPVSKETPIQPFREHSKETPIHSFEDASACLFHPESQTSS
ncbi:unnamed protein product [Aureobasidium uvarum]|uniref:Uncharacterized protein n=1 Tax=Aureobasidium uvarum TaxID=2773716 RepID=A0A9N8PU43_9PEZI|nr:unnamed protein product [Aureobasidium uvarum]